MINQKLKENIQKNLKCNNVNVYFIWSKKKKSILFNGYWNINSIFNINFLKQFWNFLVWLHLSISHIPVWNFRQTHLPTFCFHLKIRVEIIYLYQENRIIPPLHRSIVLMEDLQARQPKCTLHSALSQTCYLIYWDHLFYYWVHVCMYVFSTKL